MRERKGEAKGALLKIVILSVSLVTMLNNTISVSLGSIQEAFPQVSTVKLQCLLAYPTLSMTMFILISGILISFLGNRVILLIGLFLYTVSGVLPMFLNDFQHILISRLVMGIGLGLFFPLSLGLITDFYEGEERVTAMGQQFAVGNLGQTIALLATGLLSSINWRYGFLVYGLGGVIFILVFLFLPEKPARTTEEKSDKSVQINGSALCVAAALAFYNMVYIIMHSNLSLVMKSQHIGTSATVSGSMAFMTLISTVSGMYFGRLYDRIGELVGIMSGAAIACSFGMLIMADQPWEIYLALSLMGLGNALIMPYGYYHTSRVCPPQSAKFCLALTQALLCFGSFASPFVVNLLRVMLAQDGERFPFATALAGMGILNIILFFYWMILRKRGGTQ
ncbi:MFS transporter [Lachnospiraceae bacterium 62-35]